MLITTSQVEGQVPVTVMRLEGDLDASNYQLVIAKAREIYSAGTRNLVLDLSRTPYMSSSGLVALHSVALLLRGERPPDPEAGWGALRAIDRDRESGLQKCVKLLSPQPRVDRVLEMAGFRQFFEVYTDLDTAIASF